MIEYIYIVKCPGCEDEMFNFFTDARMQCDLLMSKKPIITQVEVERNDFGECTDFHDLGTVWSWEEAMKDTEGGYTNTEPTKSIFTKDDLKPWIEDEDPEFDNLDNSVDCEEPETSEVSPVERKPIPEGMTIEQLVEEMEENEDTVECTLCNDLFDKSTCRKELNLGWLCRRCADDLVARGEGPVFKEDNYWDFLDEDLKPITWICEFDGKEIGTVEAVTEEEAYKAMEHKYYDYNYGLYDGVAVVYPADENELTEASLSDIAAAANSEFGTFWDDDYLLDVAGVDDDFRSIDSFGDTFPKKPRELSPEKIAEREAKEAEHERQKNMRFAQRYVAKYGAERYNSQYPIGRQNWNQEWPYYDEATGEFVEGERRDELVKKFEAEQNAKRQAEYEERRKQPLWHIRYKYNNRDAHFMTQEGNNKEEALTLAIEYIKELAAEKLAKGRRFDWKESDVKVVAGRGPGEELQHFEEDLEPESVHDLGNEYDGGYPTEKPELPEIDEVPDSHLKLCPECGKETFDMETGICVECGFN